MSDSYRQKDNRLLCGSLPGPGQKLKACLASCKTDTSLWAVQTLVNRGPDKPKTED